MTEPSPRDQGALSRYIDVLVPLSVVLAFAILTFSLFKPLLPILIWATILAVALHPAWASIKRGTGSGIAASACIGALGLLILLGPTLLVVNSAIDSIGLLATKLSSGEHILSMPDEAIKQWPIVGERVYALWVDASTNFRSTAEHFSPQIQNIGSAMLGIGAGLLAGLLQFTLSIIFAAVFLTYSDALAKTVHRVAERIDGARGRNFADMAGATTRNVSRGVIGVAILQGGLASIGILTVNLPFAGFIAILCVAACVVQVPFLVIVPTIIYVWTAEPTMTAVFYTVFMIPVLFSDNVLKPVLMSRGLETPMVVILIGVIGGTISAGLLGLFIGPVVLAVFYKMIQIWLSSVPQTPPAKAIDKAE